MDEPTPDMLRSRSLPRLREELEDLRHASDISAEQRKPVELDQQSVGRLSQMDAMQQQAMAAAQDARRQGRIRAIEAVLQRIQGEDFARCDACGEFIGEQRLDLEPRVASTLTASSRATL